MKMSSSHTCPDCDGVWQNTNANEINEIRVITPPKKNEYITSDIKDFNIELNKYTTTKNATFLDEWIENCNSHESNTKNIVILYGTGANGKTTIIRNMELYIGKERVLRRRITDNTLIPPEIGLVILNYQRSDNLSQLSKLYKYGVDFIIETNEKLNIPMDCIEYVKVIDMTYTFKDGTSKIAYA